MPVALVVCSPGHSSWVTHATDAVGANQKGPALASTARRLTHLTGGTRLTLPIDGKTQAPMVTGVQANWPRLPSPEWSGEIRARAPILRCPTEA